MSKSWNTRAWRAALGVGLAVTSLIPGIASAQACTAGNTIQADVVAIDQPLMWNRLGAQNINGMMFALAQDVISLSGQDGQPTNRKWALRPDKRPRPLVLRVPAGSCLQVNFENRLAPVANPNEPVPGGVAGTFPNCFVAEAQTFCLPIDDQVADRFAGFRAPGLQLVGSIASDASFVGVNANSLVPTGGTATYTFLAEKEGTFLATSYGATFGGDGSQGNSSVGLFGQVTVEPPGARIYRSTVTEEEFRLVTKGTTADGFPVIDYEKLYPNTPPWNQEGKAGLPVLNMIQNGKIVHTAIDAIIAGPLDDGKFPASTYPLESRVPSKRVPSLPNRLEPFREFASLFHDEMATANAFPLWFRDPVLNHTLQGTRDAFMINYGSGGIGSEIIANRLGVGPMHDCLDCAYEEFFLTSYAVGDVAQLVDKPANAGLENCSPALGAACANVGPKATKGLYPDDPANIHHSYTGDFVKFRNVHSGKEHHIFHLHNHQWLYNPNDDNANYLDAQAIGPGQGYTYEINNGGSGNRNKSAGDAIFHCHFYPHFAQGMWYMWRINDTLQTGTNLAVSGGLTSFHTTPYALFDGTPAPGARAYPDGEIAKGAPIPGVIPLPGKAMAPLPGAVTVAPKVVTNPIKLAECAAVVDDPNTPQNEKQACIDAASRTVGSVAKVARDGKNPGYPFWVAGMEHIVGQRPTTPPLDMWAEAGGWDGGLPRHALEGFASGGFAGGEGLVPTRLNFDKEVLRAKPVWFEEEGTDLERIAMAFHAQRLHPTKRVLLTGEVQDANFVTNGNGLPVALDAAGAKIDPNNKLRAGGPFSIPCIDDDGKLLRAGVTGNFFAGDFTNGIRGSSPFNMDTPRVYKGANFQFDAVFNKAGYHYSQERIVGLWEDVMPVINKEKPAEPLVMRNNTFDCTLYQHTNLVPKRFELDDYQVTTPTDIIGQHIHLPKWDLTTTDGAANGWNYEDGTLAAGAVVERIEAINCFNGHAASCHHGATPGPESSEPVLEAKKHPFFPLLGPGGAKWAGARVTLQRWFFDPVVNVDGVDRGLGIIFTHDHYGPSTHQQIGLYSTVLVEPAGSKWVHNETGQALHTRPDGGPTSWQAAILTGRDTGYGAYPFRGADIDGDGRNDSYREFYIEYSDFQHAYQPGVYVGADQKGVPAPNTATATSFQQAINPPVRVAVAGNTFPDVTRFPPVCPGDAVVVGGVPRPCPGAISATDDGMLVAGYRNEPIALRVFNPNKPGPDAPADQNCLGPDRTGCGAQTDGPAGDLAFALQSRTDRAIPAMNVQPTAATTINGTSFPPPLNQLSALNPGDPFTPMMRAYFGDRIRVKVQAGGHEHPHNVTLHGLKWLQGGSGFGFASNSGWRASQQAGISEQFSFAAPITPSLRSGAIADYLWSVDASNDGFWSGMWGLIRTYNQSRTDLFRLPNTAVPFVVANQLLFRGGACPLTAPVRSYDVTAVLANVALGNQVGATLLPDDRSGTQHVGALVNDAGGTLVYNNRSTTLTNGKQGPLHDPTAMMWVRTADLDAAGKLRAGAPAEPLVLRAAAGECISVTMRNRLPALAPDLAGYGELLRIVKRRIEADGSLITFNNNLIRPSSFVGLNPQLVNYDIETGNGVVVGTNDPANAIVPPGGQKTVFWYAGDIAIVPTAIPNIGLGLGVPVEFGATNLGPADRIKQGQKGLVGQLVIEPARATWVQNDQVIDHQTTAAGARRRTNASATVNGAIRSHSIVWQRGLNQKYKDGTPIQSLAAEGIGLPEDSEDTGQMAVNYGSEPLWFRFGVAPDAPFGRAGVGAPGAVGALAVGFGDIPNAHEAYSNGLGVNGVTVGQLVTATGATVPVVNANTGDPVGDPVTPIFTSPAGAPTRIHTSMAAGSGRPLTLTVHGHLWQRTPYVCPGSAKDGLPGKCQNTGFYPTLSGAGGPFEVGSRAFGNSPISWYDGTQDMQVPASHWNVLIPAAGGASRITGDYLFRDLASMGNTAGMWGILRVQ